MLKKLKVFGLAAALFTVPSLSSAFTVTLDDLATVGIDETVVGVDSAFYSGSVGAFQVNIAFGSINLIGDTYQLNSTSIETAGVGSLQLAFEQAGLSGLPQPSSLSLVGTGSVSDIGSSVSIAHYIDLGAGYVLVDRTMDFLSPDGPSQSDSVGAFIAEANVFSLKTVIDITNTVSDFTSNVNATLNVSAVPLPAAAWLFGSALFGLVVVARRKQA